MDLENFEKCVNLLVSQGLEIEEARRVTEVAFRGENIDSPSNNQEKIYNSDFANNTFVEEQRYVLGPALIPNHIDSHGTIFPESTVRKAAHNFMKEYQQNKFMHMIGLDKEDVSIVESYILPNDIVINNKNYKKGTWMMGVVVHNDKIWNYVKKGKIRGFSIGARVTGAAISVSEAD